MQKKVKKKTFFVCLLLKRRSFYLMNFNEILLFGMENV